MINPVSLSLCLCAFVFNFSLMAVTVSSSINQNLGQENYPVNGTIFITHTKNEKIDSSSFILEKKPLTVNLVKDTPLSNDHVISIYSFTLPGQPQGLYIFPSVSVKVGGKVYQSAASTYEITGIPSPAPAARPAAPSVQRSYTPQGNP